MKTLITIIVCLFVNAANAEDKWEYMEITYDDQKSFKNHLTVGYYKDKRFFFSGKGYKSVGKSDFYWEWDEALEKNRKQSQKDAFGRWHVPAVNLIDLLQFYGGFGYELVSERTVSNLKTKYILKRKRN